MTNAWLRVDETRIVSAPALAESQIPPPVDHGLLASRMLLPLSSPTVNSVGLALNATTPPPTLFRTELFWRLERVDPAIPPAFIQTLESPPPLHTA